MYKKLFLTTIFLFSFIPNIVSDEQDGEDCASYFLKPAMPIIGVTFFVGALVTIFAGYHEHQTKLFPGDSCPNKDFKEPLVDKKTIKNYESSQSEKRKKQ